MNNFSKGTCLLLSFLLSLYISPTALAEDAVTPSTSPDTTAAPPESGEPRNNSNFTYTDIKISNQGGTQVDYNTFCDSESVEKLNAAPREANTLFVETVSGARAGAGVAQGAADAEASGGGDAEIFEDYSQVVGLHLRTARPIIHDKRKMCKCAANEQYRNLPPDNPQHITHGQYDRGKDEVQRRCREYVGMVVARVDEGIVTAGVSQRNGGIAKKLLTAGLIAGGAYLAYDMLLKGDGDKDDEKSEEETAAEKAAKAERGIITLADGTEVNCKQTNNLSVSECRPFLMSFCQEGGNQNLGGCNAFNNYYCGAMGEGLDTMYCQYSAAQLYCTGTGDLISQSPACQWIEARPSEKCKDDPEAIDCRVAKTPEELNQACQSFPSDPICRVRDTVNVTQPNGGSSGGAYGGGGGSIAAVGDGSSNDDDTSNASGNDSKEPGDAPPIAESQPTVDLGDGQGAVSMSDVTTGSRGTASATPDLISNASDVTKSLCGKVLNCDG